MQDTDLSAIPHAGSSSGVGLGFRRGKPAQVSGASKMKPGQQAQQMLEWASGLAGGPVEILRHDSRFRFMPTVNPKSSLRYANKPALQYVHDVGALEACSRLQDTTSSPNAFSCSFSQGHFRVLSL